MAMNDEERKRRTQESRLRYLEKNAERLKNERRKKYAADKEGAKVAATEWRHANKTAHKAAVKRYRAANPDVKRAEKAKRRAAVRGVGGRYTKADVQALFSAQSGLCVYCRAELNLYEVDHVLPLALGGCNDVKNLQLLCPSCNRAKGATHPQVYAEQRGVAYG